MAFWIKRWAFKRLPAGRQVQRFERKPPGFCCNGLQYRAYRAELVLLGTLA
jgi:hypothetical protein